jgi:hypothetical protein
MFAKFTPEKFNALYKEGFGVSSFNTTKHSCLQLLGDPNVHAYETYLSIIPEHQLLELINSGLGQITIKRCSQYPHLFMVAITTNDWSRLNAFNVNPPPAGKIHG